MATMIVVGGQYGGEGKGAISAYLAKKEQINIAVKTGGPNSSHTFSKNGTLISARMIPACANFGAQFILFPAGCLIHIETLFDEIQKLDISATIIIDPMSGVIKAKHIVEQKNDDFYKSHGSTYTGTGHAISERSLRRLTLSKHEKSLEKYLGNCAKFIVDSEKKGHQILIEGSQSFGLSNYHGDYPFTTSRDTIVGEFLSQCGIGPKYLGDICLVIKCFPTRNKGGDGSLPLELSEDEIDTFHPYLTEYGGGTYNQIGYRRRVGLFSIEIVQKAVIANSPSYIALTGLDRLKALLHLPKIREHYGSIEELIKKIEVMTEVPVRIQSWGPYVDDILDNKH